MRSAAKRKAAEGARRRALLAVALVGGLVPLTGCATKRDVRTLQQEIAVMRMQQDSMLRSIQRQNEQLLDSLRTAMSITQDVRGQTSHRFQQLEQTLAQTQALVGQVMQVSQELMNRLSAMPAQSATPAQPGGVSGGGTAEEYYQLGLEKMGERSYTAARTAFQH